MTGDHRSRLYVITAFLGLVALCTYGIWHYGYQQALGQLDRQARADLTLAADRFTGQLRRYRELAVFMADHPVLTRLADDDAIRADV